jgi:hypothetical protein
MKLRDNSWKHIFHKLDMTDFETVLAKHQIVRSSLDDPDESGVATGIMYAFEERARLDFTVIRRERRGYYYLRLQLGTIAGVVNLKMIFAPDLGPPIDGLNVLEMDWLDGWIFTTMEEIQGWLRTIGPRLDEYLTQNPPKISGR